MVCELYLDKAVGKYASGETSQVTQFWPAVAEESQDVSLSGEPYQ